MIQNKRSGLVFGGGIYDSWILWLRILKTIADQSDTKTTINEKVRLILVNHKLVAGSDELILQ